MGKPGPGCSLRILQESSEPLSAHEIFQRSTMASGVPSVSKILYLLGKAGVVVPADPSEKPRRYRAVNGHGEASEDRASPTKAMRSPRRQA
jgi:Fe2+ or Zn2+ uptake regulation protein